MLTRISIAFVFVGIGVWEIVQPSYWSFYIPNFLTFIASALTLTMLHGIVMVALGLAILLGIYLRVSAALASVMMVLIIGDLLLSFGFNDIVIRDTAILLVALALVFDDTNYLRLRK